MALLRLSNGTMICLQGHPKAPKLLVAALEPVTPMAKTAVTMAATMMTPTKATMTPTTSTTDLAILGLTKAGYRRYSHVRTFLSLPSPNAVCREPFPSVLLSGRLRLLPSATMTAKTPWTTWASLVFHPLQNAIPVGRVHLSALLVHDNATSASAHSPMTSK